MPYTRDGFIWTPTKSSHGLQTNAVLSSKITRSQYDVIVIGAGFTGLIAARDISERSNLNVLVLEARDRIGGRTWTSRAFDMDFEMGGTWVHWHQPHVWAEIHRYNLQHSLKPSASPKELVIASSEGQLPEKADLTDTFAKLDTVMVEFFGIDGHTARTLMPFPHDTFREPAVWKAYDHLSVRDRLDQMAQEGKFDPVDLDILEVVASGVSLSSSDQTGFVEFLRWIALGGYTLQGLSDTTGTYKIGNDGMTSLARNILSDFRGDILSDAVVTEIVQDRPFGNTPVTVVLGDGRTFTAPEVISTIPLNVLKTIEFAPELPRLHQEALSVGHVGRGYKIHYKTSSPATPRVAMNLRKAKSLFNTGVSDNTDSDGEKSSHVVGFGLSGRIADVEDGRAVVTAFNRCLDDDRNSKVMGYLCHDWTADPFARGTWCTFAPGNNVKFHRELQKAHGRVRFASSDWADGWKGFVDGAIEEGKKVAIKILASLEG